MDSFSSTTISLQNILENVGMQIYCYLHPKDLLSFAICNRQYLWNDIIGDKLAKICMHNLPLHLGVGTNYLAEFREGRTFSDKAELLDYVLDKTETADLLLVDTASMEESRIRAREVLLGDENLTGRSTLKFYKNNNKYSMVSSTTVDCHYQSSITKESAVSWTRYIMDRDACKQSKKDKDTNQFIWAWLKCLFAQSSNDNNFSFGLWRWSCKHQALNDDGIAGVGVMITKSNAEFLELRLTRKY